MGTARGQEDATTAAGDSEDARRVVASVASPALFAETFELYFADIYRYAARRLGAAEGEDVAAETFMTAFARRASYLPQAGSVRGWLFGIVSNIVRHRRRSELVTWPRCRR